VEDGSGKEAGRVLVVLYFQVGLNGSACDMQNLIWPKHDMN
jgi:hypothetical protein